MSDSSYPTIIEAIDKVFTLYREWLTSEFGPITHEQFYEGVDALEKTLLEEIERIYDTSPTTKTEQET